MTPLELFIAPLSEDKQYKLKTASIAASIKLISAYPQDNHGILSVGWLLGLGRGQLINWFPASRNPQTGVTVDFSILLQVLAGKWRKLEPALFANHLTTLDLVLRGERAGTAQRLEFLISIPSHEYKELMMTNPTAEKIPADMLQKFEMSMASLEQALLTKDPMMPQHLRVSHALLIQYPDTVALLRPEQIKTLISAAQEHTKTVIISKAAKGKGKTPSKVTVDML